MVRVLLSAAMSASVIAYVDASVREGGVDSAIELAPLAEALKNVGENEAVELELSPVTAEKIIVYIDGKVREGGVDSAVELAPLAEALKQALEDFRKEPEEETFESFARDEDLSATAEAVADKTVIDAVVDAIAGRFD